MRVEVRGAGIVGLACAAELLARGHRVSVVDPTPGNGASRAAAGMLAAGGEAWFGEERLHRLGVASAALWPGYAAGLGVRLHRRGTLLLGLDHGDAQQVERRTSLLRSYGHAVEELTPATVRRLEPTLARVCAAALLPEDLAVDPREVVSALLGRLEPFVVPRSSGPADAVVWASGTNLPEPYAHLVRGVRGEVLRLHTDTPPTRVLRAEVRGEAVYVVPRPTGEVVVGATSEEHPGAAVATAGGVQRLLRPALTLLPGLEWATWREVLARDRPATHDHLPLVGATARPGEFLAAGHHRSGVLLAPLTARLLADAVEGRPPGDLAEVVDPCRTPVPEHFEENR